MIFYKPLYVVYVVIEFQGCSTYNSYVICIFKMKIQTLELEHLVIPIQDSDVIIISGLLIDSR